MDLSANCHGGVRRRKNAETPSLSCRRMIFIPPSFTWPPRLLKASHFHSKGASKRIMNLLPKGKRQGKEEQAEKGGSHTRSDYPVCGQLLDQQTRVGVGVGVELPAGDAEVEAQPQRVAAAAAVPGDALILQAFTPPGNTRRGLGTQEGEFQPAFIFLSVFF